MASDEQTYANVYVLFFMLDSFCFDNCIRVGERVRVRSMSAFDIYFAWLAMLVDRFKLYTYRLRLMLLVSFPIHGKASNIAE